MKKKFFSFLALVATFSVFAVGVSARQDNERGNSQNKKVAVTKEEKVRELKNFQKPVAGQTSGQAYKEKVEKAVGSLKKVAEEKVVEERYETQDVVGIDQQEIGIVQVAGVSEEVSAVAESIEESAEATAEAIEKVEKRNKFTKLLVGTDYKNLGQLRSSIVHNRNQIRKLTQLSTQATGETQLQIQEQIAELTQEQERIQSVINENKGGFSFFGWLFRFMSGYAPVEQAVEAEEQEQFVEEVAEVIADGTGVSGDVADPSEATPETTDETDTDSSETLPEGGTDGVPAELPVDGTTAE